MKRLHNVKRKAMAAHQAFVAACQQFGYADQFGYFGDPAAPSALVAIESSRNAILHHWYSVRDGVDAYTSGAMQK